MLGVKKIWADQGGNTAMMFGLAIIPILALSGGAVDFSYRADTRTQLQSAADSAALAAARTIQEGQTSGKVKWGKLKKSAQAAAEKMFAASQTGDLNRTTRKPRIKISRNSVTVDASTSVPTSFLAILGVDKLQADAHAEVGIPDPVSVEIALVLDYSKSMEENDKYVRMTAAAQSFVNKVAAERGNNTKIGIVPFSEYVYATVEGRHVRDTAPGDANKPVTVCLKNRDYPYSTTADEPKKSVVASRWPAADPADVQCASYVPNSLALRDLTNDFATLSNALGQMRPVGWTNIALAAEMGWHMLSPDKPFEAQDYPKKGEKDGGDEEYDDDESNYSPDDKVRKIMILLTDGVQTVNAMGPSGAVSTLAADETTAELCQNVKGVGIRVFSIAYDIEDPRVRDLLEGCASGSNAYFEPKEANDISGVFEEIFQQISESVWLSR